MPLRSHGSLSMNRALMAADLVDRVQVTLFPVITGQTGLDPIFGGAARPARLSPSMHLHLEPAAVASGSR